MADGRYVPTGAYYGTYFGHDVEYLEVALDALRARHESVVFLAGDSSLDNKYWLHDTQRAINGYEDFLHPPRMKTDVCYWLNREAVSRGLSVGCLNTAVEATALNDRACCWLQAQDRFIVRNISADDYLVVSVGGNDIALKPVLFTILNMLFLTQCVPQSCIKHGCGCPPLCPPNTCVDCGCFLCGLPGCLTGIVAFPPGLGYFLDLFGNIVQNYVLRLVGCTRPRKVLVCMIYNPDEHATGGWADGTLRILGYDSDPEKLQCLIRMVFELAVCRITIPGTEVVPFPLFEVLDGSNSRDYVARVEPSSQGGRKMAKAFMDALTEAVSGTDEAGRGSAPVPQVMR